MSLVAREIQDGIGILVLDHPKKRNALSEELVRELIEGLAAFRKAKIRAAILRARPGITVFSAGHDVGELPESRRDPLGWDDPLRHLVREIEAVPFPVIAMVEGSVWGGACESVFACDLIIAAPNASFAATPAKLGVPYNVGGILTFLNATNLRLIKEMLFTAQPIDAARAERFGIVNHLVPAEEIEEFTMAMARQIARNSPLSIAVMKEQLRILARAHPISPEGFERVQGLRRAVYDSHDYQEGIRAFKEKRKPDFKGE